MLEINGARGPDMPTMGFVFSSNDMRCLTVDGARQAPRLLDKQRIPLPQGRGPTELTVWLEQQLRLLLDRHEPSAVGYKTTLGLTTHAQIQRVYYAHAILNLLCGQRDIALEHFFPQAIVPSRLGLPKGTDLQAHVDQIIGRHPPYWDGHAREACLVAWFLLEG